jgi:paraquat-inducible protein A
MNGRTSSFDEVAALSLTGLALLLLSVFLPFLSFEANGQSNSISLWSSALELFSDNFEFLSLALVLFVIVIPGVYLSALAVLTGSLLFGVKPASSLAIARLITHISPWAMVEVFIFGVLVALIKITSMADIVMGVSFWAYVAFTAVFVRVYSIVDTHTLWSWASNDR